MEQLLANGRLNNDPKLTHVESVTRSQHSNHSFLDDDLGSCMEKRQSYKEKCAADQEDN